MDKLRYKASDGVIFEDKSDYIKHQTLLNQLKMEWFKKRHSIWWTFLYILFNIEPKKPYNF